MAEAVATLPTLGTRTVASAVAPSTPVNAAIFVFFPYHGINCLTRGSSYLVCASLGGGRKCFVSVH